MQFCGSAESRQGWSVGREWGSAVQLNPVRDGLSVENGVLRFS
jgi:hypothetical protein